MELLNISTEAGETETSAPCADDDERAECGKKGDRTGSNEENY